MYFFSISLFFGKGKILIENFWSSEREKVYFLYRVATKIMELSDINQNYFRLRMGGAVDALGASQRVISAMVGARTLMDMGSWLTSVRMPLP